MAKFISGEELTEEVYDIIFKAKKQLLIVSPYIQLDDYFKKLFDNHKHNSELHLIVAFGKNEKNPQRSLKKNDIDYFKAFPNISVVYIPNLHAKYYANEKKGIITSINLYDYSFDNNVEFGVISETKLIGGSNIDKEAWNTAMTIISENYTVFIKRPNYKKKLLGFGKDYVGSEVIFDETEVLLNGSLPAKKSVFDFLNESYVNAETNTTRISKEEFTNQSNFQASTMKSATPKYLSATNLGKIRNKTFNEVIETMIENNYLIDKETITEKGKSIGIRHKENSKGNRWIVYPESLAEIL